MLLLINLALEIRKLFGNNKAYSFRSSISLFRPSLHCLVVDIFQIMDEDSDQVTTIIGALEQLYDETGHLLARYKTQVEMENDTSAEDPILAAKQHFAVYDSVTTEWKIVRMLYEMLLSSTQAESVDKDVQSMESILMKLATGQVKFQYYEFQVPFQIHHILNTAKLHVITYLKRNAPQHLKTNEFVKNLAGVIDDSIKHKTVEKDSEVIDVSNVKSAAMKFQSIADKKADLTPERKLLAREVTRKVLIFDYRAQPLTPN